MDDMWWIVIALCILIVGFPLIMFIQFCLYLGVAALRPCLKWSPPLCCFLYPSTRKGVFDPSVLDDMKSPPEELLAKTKTLTIGKKEFVHIPAEEGKEEEHVQLLCDLMLAATTVEQTKHI